MAFLVQNMAWPQVEAQIKQCPAALVPIGSTEQHGYHLPLGTDIFLAERLAALVSDRTGALVYPSVNYGYSWVWRDRPGTVSLHQEHLRLLLIDIVRSVERHGISVLIFLNGHEANGATIKYAVRDIQDETKVKVLGMFYPGLQDVYREQMASPTWHGMFHACEFETSLMLAADESMVDMALATAEYPEKPRYYGMDNTSIGDLSKSGVYGNPTIATKEKGNLMFNLFADQITGLLAGLL